MRLRQLGTSQSIVFIASPEVNQSILDHRQTNPDYMVDARDVVSWVLEQTCLGNEQLQPLYIAQGDDFCRRRQAAAMNAGFLSIETDRRSYIDVLLQQEQQTLEEMYKPGTMAKSSSSGTRWIDSLKGFVDTLRQLQESMEEQNHVPRLCSALAEVEQQREVACQVEVELDPQRPLHFGALGFLGLHPRLRGFAETGVLLGFGWCESVFFELGRTKIARKYGIRTSRQSRLFVSAEFTRTIERENEEHCWHDDFLVCPRFLLSRPILTILAPRPLGSLEPRRTKWSGYHPERGRGSHPAPEELQQPTYMPRHVCGASDPTHVPV